MRWSVAATSASRFVSAGGNGSGAALVAGTAMPGEEGSGGTTGTGVSAGVPDGGVAIALYAPDTSVDWVSTDPVMVAPALCASGWGPS